MYQTAGADSQHANANCGLNTCASADPARLEVYLEYFGGFMLVVEAVIGVYVLVTGPGSRLGHRTE